MNRSWKCHQNLKEIGRERLAALSVQYDIAMMLTGQGWKEGEMIALGALQHFTSLEEIRVRPNDYLFGHLGYDLKSELCGVKSRYIPTDAFEPIHFFVPEIILHFRNHEWWIGYTDELHLAEFQKKLTHFQRESTNNAINLTSVTSKEDYIRKCNSILRHIQRGDIYEINYCIDFSGTSEQLDPVRVFSQLCDLSEAPMSVLYRRGSSWLMCASPERYISRTGNTVTSQPIKGTIRRGNSEKEDLVLREQLLNDPKERSENVMIVDLVRNDLSRIASKGSVKVSELFGIYPFKTVHQMISTVECSVEPQTDVTDIIGATFPMGSMTGAPKISAMNLAEEHEEMSRGIYSGSVGYIMPGGDFDFNVVIRGLTWNSETGLVSAKAGSAITAKSVPEKEYEECMLKVKAMMSALKTV